eukprot:1161629-Pelagomonas_calceolata.AAC.9
MPRHQVAMSICRGENSSADSGNASCYRPLVVLVSLAYELGSFGFGSQHPSVHACRGKKERRKEERKKERKAMLAKSGRVH